MEQQTIHSVVEALILASPDPIAARKVAEVSDDLTPGKITKVVAELNNRYMESGSSFRIRQLAGGFQFYILPEYGGFVDDLFARRRKMRLTRASLETLSIIAYKQPVTKSDIEHIRGVASDGVINNLLQKNMVVLKGRAKGPGRPLQYGTGDEFLKFFGLNSLDDLPKMKEIEQLIGAQEAERQPELPLSFVGEDDKSMKLNVADGTFDPNRDEDDFEEQLRILTRPEPHENTESVATGDEESVAESKPPEESESASRSEQDDSDGNGNSDHEVVMESTGETTEK